MIKAREFKLDTEDDAGNNGDVDQKKTYKLPKKKVFVYRGKSESKFAVQLQQRRDLTTNNFNVSQALFTKGSLSPKLNIKHDNTVKQLNKPKSFRKESQVRFSLQDIMDA